jgi:hypothetical protein
VGSFPLKGVYVLEKNMFKYGGNVTGLDHLRGFVLNTKPPKRPIKDMKIHMI